MFDRVLNTPPLLREKCPYSEFSGPHFHTFRLNTETYSVNLFFSPNVGNADQKNSEYDHFLRSVYWQKQKTMGSIYLESQQFSSTRPDNQRPKNSRFSNFLWR